ncbi:uncharacterized protein L199_003997 [Kwoniella botswanensis]|uniref:uncharacterized protein n=1 Tax=Kwoniella botswanensis TaxID=1268659 RepID=UPI00315D694B
MPAIPQPTSSSRAKHFRPPDPNHAPRDLSSHRPSNAPIPEPSPKIISSKSHREHHIPRRFIGSIPQKTLNSNEVVEKRRRLSELKRSAISHLPFFGEANGSNRDGTSFIGSDSHGEADERHLIREAARRIKIRRRDRNGEEFEQHLELDPETPLEDGSKGKTGSKGKGKDMWSGESFDIGREFLGTIVDDQEEEEEPPPPKSTTQEKGKEKEQRKPIRPTVSTRTTQDSFVTARTEFTSLSTSEGNTSKSTLALDEGHGDVDIGYQVTPQPSLGDNPDLDQEEGDRSKIRNSQSSSIQPLISENAITVTSTHDVLEEPSTLGTSTIKPSPKKIKSNEGISTKLKSALRRPSNVKLDITSTKSAQGNNSSSSTVFAVGKQGKSKSVQFPLDPTQPTSSLKRLGRVQEGNESVQGDRDPVHPMKVLERTGQEAEGTSHQAVEIALEEEEEDWEEVKRPGEVILRDRMIVRVGYHREDKLPGFDEAAQRRNPCARLDPLEEYIVIYRKNQIELYSNYNYPFQEKIVGHKHLAFVIPLIPHRTSLSIFNPEDVTLCLTTSVYKLQDDVSYLMRSNSSRLGDMRNRIKQSKQIQWLKGHNKGSQVFIMKLGERSRSLDWYWEIWKELNTNGEEGLPDRFDIQIPSLSTSIRLFTNPTGDDEYDPLGSTSQLEKFEKTKVIETCWKMLLDSDLNVEDLKRQSESASTSKGQLDLQLVWKNQKNGNLDWIAYGDTVQGKKRGWNLLSGLARAQGETTCRDLQLRSARHRPSLIKLEDGTSLEEPPGIEGYLTRHKDGSTKEQVYISSHDGNIFVGNMKEARPPLPPSKESSTPSELFPELYKTFIDEEHRRMASFLARCSGCIDLRDIVSIKILPDKTKHQHQPRPSMPQEPYGRTFEVEVNTGGNVRLEAQSPELAKEWVDNLRGLKKYWERRHRVDARQRMDVITLHSRENPFTGTELSNESDDFLSEVWDWCVIKGCRSITVSGRLFMRKDKWDKFRSKYIVLSGGTLISFKIKKKNAFHTRKKRYPLFGAYVYSGMLALDEIPSTSSSDAFTSESRVYQDGLQSSDGAEDTTFCVRLTSPSSSKKEKGWGKKVTQPWENQDLVKDQNFLPPDLSKRPSQLLIFRARSKLERDRWVWAINAEMERQVRSHVKQEEILRNHGIVPDRW